MTLYDLSMVLQDNFDVVIYGNNGDMITRYDGSSVIFDEYADCEVTDIYPNGEHELCVCIDDSDVILDDDDDDFDDDEDDEIEYRNLRDME